ncbi:MAG: amino acid ABC transporter permease [Cellulosilyticaceae bacterium]
MELDFSVVWSAWPFLWNGLLTTLKFTALSAVIGFVWGTLLTFIKISKIKPLVWLGQFYTSIFRGTPLLVQLSLIYFATPQITGYNISPLEAGVLTFGLNSAAYISEIFRGGISGIDKGQREAAMALGVSYKDMMFDIIMPQAIKHILPSLVNESIALLKESSLLAFIGVMDILRAAEQITVMSFRYFEPYLVAAFMYYILVMIMTAFANRLERWVNRSDNL